MSSESLQYCPTPVPAVAVIQVVQPVRYLNRPKGYAAGDRPLEARTKQDRHSVES